MDQQPEVQPEKVTGSPFAPSCSPAWLVPLSGLKGRQRRLLYACLVQSDSPAGRRSHSAVPRTSRSPACPVRRSALRPWVDRPVPRAPPARRVGTAVKPASGSRQPVEQWPARDDDARRVPAGALEVACAESARWNSVGQASAVFAADQKSSSRLTLRALSPGTPHQGNGAHGHVPGRIPPGGRSAQGAADRSAITRHRGRSGTPPASASGRALDGGSL